MGSQISFLFLARVPRLVRLLSQFLTQVDSVYPGVLFCSLDSLMLLM